MKCLTRQWLELTISAYRSRIAYLPHSIRLCYPERNASSFLNRMILLTEKRISIIPNNKIRFKLSHQKKSRHKEIWLLWQCGYSFLFLSILQFYVGVVRPCLLHTCILSVHITPRFMHLRRLYERDSGRIKSGALEYMQFELCNS